MEGYLFVVGWTSTPSYPIDGRRKVVGEDQYPSMGKFRKPPLVAMADPGPPWWRDERTSTNTVLNAGMKLGYKNDA